MLGTPEEILTRADELAQLNLDMPASCCLGRALRAKGVPVCAQVREADMVAEVAQAYTERSEAGTAGQSSASQSEIADGAVPADNEDNASEPVIEISHLSYSYSLSARERRRWHKRSAAEGASNKQTLWGNDPSSPWALRDVSLTVCRGEFLGLAGHTGSGKSTLVQHLNGRIRPQEGSVYALGLDLSSKKDAAAVKAKVGVVFQYPERQLFAETVTQDVAFGPRNLGLSQAEVARRVESSLARVTGGPLGGVRMLGSVAIPLFTGVFRHAETLSAAMDARCYHGEQGRTRLHALAFGRGDALAAVVTALLLICVIVINLKLV